MPVSADVVEKTKKNLIVHHYEYHSLSQELKDQIRVKENELVALRKKLGAVISIYLPEDHPIFKNKLFNNKLTGEFQEGTLVEWTTNRMEASGNMSESRELLYVEKIEEDADITGVFDAKVKYVTNFSDERYKHICCFSYGRKAFLRLRGLDMNDIKR
jgi:hypothetical protein